MTVEPVRISLSELTWRVSLSQWVFTAGHSLTTGGFLYYFLNDLGPVAWLMSLYQVTPEMAETAGVLARPLALASGNRKLVWIVSLIVARLCALGLPIVALLTDQAGATAWGCMLVLLVGWYAAQGISYAALISWLSDLSPRQNWGRFFARRSLAHIIALLLVPMLAAWVREKWINQADATGKLWSFLVVFVCGDVLALLSLLPLLRVPDLPGHQQFASAGVLAPLLAGFREPRLRWLLVHSFWLSAFQGFSQTAAFLLSSRWLQIPLPVYYMMASTMYLLQMPLSVWAGRWSDRGRERVVLSWGLIAVAVGVCCLVAASFARGTVGSMNWSLTPNSGPLPIAWLWVWVSYVLLGAFGAINVAVQNLLLRLAPPSDNAVAISVQRQWTGLLAGLLGMLGGVLLDSRIAQLGPLGKPTKWVFEPELGLPLQVAQTLAVILGISAVGRLLSIGWLWLIKDIQPSRNDMSN